jgi:H+/gluconate symporter-like permease
VWTIVLGILLGIAIIFIIILIVMYVLAERKVKREQEQDLREQHQRTNGNGHNGIGAYENGRHAVSNPLLANEWDKPAHPPHAFAHHGVESESNHSGSVEIF